MRVPDVGLSFLLRHDIIIFLLLGIAPTLRGVFAYGGGGGGQSEPTRKRTEMIVAPYGMEHMADMMAPMPWDNWRNRMRKPSPEVASIPPSYKILPRPPTGAPAYKSLMIAPPAPESPLYPIRAPKPRRLERPPEPPDPPPQLSIVPPPRRSEFDLPRKWILPSPIPPPRQPYRASKIPYSYEKLPTRLPTPSVVQQPRQVIDQEVPRPPSDEEVSYVPKRVAPVIRLPPRRPSPPPPPQEMIVYEEEQPPQRVQPTKRIGRVFPERISKSFRYIRYETKPNRGYANSVRPKQKLKRPGVYNARQWLQYGQMPMVAPNAQIVQFVTVIRQPDNCCSNGYGQPACCCCEAPPPTCCQPPPPPPIQLPCCPQMDAFEIPCLRGCSSCPCLRRRRRRTRRFIPPNLLMPTGCQHCPARRKSRLLQ